MPVIDEIKVPLVSVNDTTLTVVQVPFETGAAVKKGDTILVFETSKTTYDVIAEKDGFIQILCEEGSDYAVSEVVARLFSQSDEIPLTQSPVEKSIQKGSVTTPEASWKGETLFSMAALSLIEELSIDKSSFVGRDFITREDVEFFAGIKKDPIGLSNGPVTKKNITVEVGPNVTVQKVASNKKREIAFLSEVQSTGLTSTIHTFIETEGLFEHINASLNVLKNSLLPVIVYEAGRLLTHYTALNAYFAGDSIAFYKDVNIGFAIDVDKGLKVLNIKNAASKSILNIEEEIIHLSNKYLDDKLSVEDLTEITFTITDLSSEGVFLFKPLVNSMNSAILGVSSIDERFNRCNLSLTFDHRITEGKLVAQFLNELKQNIESYRSNYFSNPRKNISCFKCFKKLQNDLSDVGFAKCITPEGAEAYICQSCFKGY